MFPIVQPHLPLRVLIAVVLVLLATLNFARVAREQSTALPTTVPFEVVSNDDEETSAELLDELDVPAKLHEERLLGTWEQDKFGRRRLTILPEGKAKMLIEPSGAWSLAFGPKLEAEMFWSIERGRIIYGMTSGTPAAKYEIAVKAWGDRWNESLTELTDTRLVVTADDGTVSVWQRVAE